MRAGRLRSALRHLPGAQSLAQTLRLKSFDDDARISDNTALETKRDTVGSAISMADFAGCVCAPAWCEACMQTVRVSYVWCM
jgi:hypothetical protein